MSDWTIASARQNFSSLLDACREGIQPIYRRHQLIAAVVDVATYERLQAQANKRPTLADSFRELRQILAQEPADTAELATLPRLDRHNAFLDVLGD
jgi:predicted TIM-barrel fold metal-dependent hydrolase